MVSAEDREFAEWLIDEKVGTLAPATAAWMIRTAEDVVTAGLKLSGGHPLRARAKAYATALLLVAKDMGTQQGAVIERVGALVNAAAGQEAKGST